MAIKHTVNSTLMSDQIVRPEFLGLTTLCNPFSQHASSQRLTMFSSHSAQAMVIAGAEQARIMSGYEQQVGKYEFTPCRVEQDMLVRAVIPKYNPTAFKTGGSAEMPMWTVIYSGEDDGLVHCMDVSTYTYLHDGFGYFNKMLCLEEDRLYPGQLIPKGTKLTTSPSHDDTRWMMGVNGNVVYMGEWGSTEDACVISRSLAEKGSNTAIFQTKLNIGVDDIPLNLYGDEENYKCFPGIGETVNPDGVLIGLRKNNLSTFMSDMIPSRLRTTEGIHDELHKAPPGSKVIDVDVFVNKQTLRKMKDRDDSLYRQFLDLNKAQEYYYNTILETYTKLCSKDGEGLPYAPEFSALVTKAACLSSNRKFVSKEIKLYDARDPIEFITIVITYAFTRKITLGSKITDRSGGKGVVSAIWEDENMPVDDNGVRADIIMTPPSIINRMNPSQMLEQFWTRAGMQVMWNARAKWLHAGHDEQRDWRNDPLFQKNWKHIWDYIIGFFNDFRPAYAKFMCEVHPTDSLKMSLVEASLVEGLYLINNFRQPNTSQDILNVTKKYGIEKTPITYRVQNKETGEWTTVRTENKMLIGSKYLMVLGKIPASVISAVSLGHVSQHETPIKPKSKHIKSQNVIGLTPQKFGEDETCILNMSIGPAAIARLYGMYATSPEVVKALAARLLTDPTPTALPCLEMTTQEVIDKNVNVNILTHELACIGYDVRHDKVK